MSGVADPAPDQPDDLAVIVAALESRLGPAEGVPAALEGGITNRNYRLRMGGVDYVLRVTGKDTSVLGIDREAEVAATRAANEAGVAPPVADYLAEHECLVTRFVEGRPVTADELRDPAVLAQVADSIRLVHAGPAFPSTFSCFRIVETYEREAHARGARIPPALAPARAAAARIEAVCTGPDHDPVPCHNDLLTANFIDDGTRVRIVDWEYAGMGDRFFDLGNLSVNNGFDAADDARLVAAYFGPGEDREAARRLATVRLFRVMSDFREAMWGVVQSVVSELDFDYDAYADEHFDRLLAAADDPTFEEHLHAATP